MYDLRERVCTQLLPAGAICLLLASSSAGSVNGDFVADDEAQGPPAATFRMPHVAYSPLRGGVVVFCDEDDRVWTVSIDPAFGRLVDPGWRDTLVGTAAHLDHEMDGPKFAAAFDSSQVFFTGDQDGVAQPWRLDFFWHARGASPLAADGVSRTSPEPRSDSRAGSVDYFYVRSEAGVDALAVANAAEPTAEYPLPEAVVAPSSACWVPGSRAILYARRTGGGVQLALFDAATREARVVTDDAGEKSLPAAVAAPDFGGQPVYLAVLDGREIGVYEDDGGEAFRRVATVGIPAGSLGDVIRSVEPFAAEGRTFAAVEIGSAASAESEIWVLELGGDPPARLCRRVDGGGPARRVRPQVFVGMAEVIVFYSLVRETGTWELRRCATGIAASPDRSPPAVRDVAVHSTDWRLERGRPVSISWEAYDDTGVVAQKVMLCYGTGEADESDDGETVVIAGDLPGNRRSYRWTPDRELPASRNVYVDVVAFDAEGNYSRGRSCRLRIR